MSITLKWTDYICPFSMVIQLLNYGHKMQTLLKAFKQQLNLDLISEMRRYHYLNFKAIAVLLKCNKIWKEI